MSLPTQKLDVKTDEQRERIVFGRAIGWGKDTSGQFARIGRLGEFGPDYITPETFSKLIDKGYINPSSTQNASPTMGQLCELGETVLTSDSVGSVRYTGYMIGPKRADARITITAITIKPKSDTILSKDVQKKFENVCQTGDEYERDGYRCHAWWD